MEAAVKIILIFFLSMFQLLLKIFFIVSCARTEGKVFWFDERMRVIPATKMQKQTQLFPKDRN